MLRTPVASPAPPSNLRRRHQAARDRRSKNGSHSSAHEPTYDGSNGLDLSMHLPSKPLSNRFDVLSDHWAAGRRNKDYHVTKHTQRTRHSRGSKEGKKRRDARRNQRKHDAARMIDEQLSRDIDRTLSQAYVQWRQSHTLSSPTPTLPSPTPALSTTTIPPPPPVHIPSTAPQLPFLNFGGLDLMNDMPDLAPRKPGPTPLLSPGTLNIPSWCPALPSLVGSNAKWSELPIFFDLSSLPEPTEPPKPERKCQELQLWQPKISSQLKKQSRFFPAPAPPKPSVKLPPVACKLHDANRGPKDAMSSESVDGGVKLPLDFPGVAMDKSDIQQIGASAANLWSILSSPAPANILQHEPYLDSFAPRNEKDSSANAFDPLDYWSRADLPAELDNTEIPFVHANSLTGYANERGGVLLPELEEHVVFESPSAMTPMAELDCGLNELMVNPYPDDDYTDKVLAALELILNKHEKRSNTYAAFVALPPPSAPSSPCQELDIADVLSVECANVTSEEEITKSDAHFKSEQALFELPTTPIKPADAELIDVATFLKMGHTMNCWCRECEEPPELVGGDTLTEDEGWMVYSSSVETQTPSVASSWESDCDTWIGDEEREASRSPCPNQPEWEDFFPSRRAHGCW